ncbi:MAG TPA: YceI family protein [Flavisolibacter sp.]|nr:YceI family protein [Flavisolibacter sp.]
MKHFLVLLFSVASAGLTVNAQSKFFTKNGKILFFSKAPLEDIEAKNKSAVCLLDAQSGTIQFSLLMKGFEFENELMQEHFNDDYVESHKFPKAEFKGQIINNASINYKKSGIYPVKVKGKLTIHGETKDVETNGTIAVNGDNLHLSSNFPIQLSDYKIKIPSLVKDKVSNSIKIMVEGKLEPFQ